MRFSWSSLLASLLLARRLTAQTLPYNPTSIFQSPGNSDTIYILQPPSSLFPHGQLVALNISSTIQASSLKTATLTPSLPFLASDNNANMAYLPAMSKSGSITVFAGSCSATSSLWIYHPPSTSAAASSSNSDNGTWSHVSNVASSLTTGLSSATFLGTSFAFSTFVDANDTQRTIYAFGGMCPTSTNVNSSNWQSTATYSNRMLKLSTPSTTSLQVSLSSSAGNNPIPEAGFTITGLTPTISNSSSGLVSQAQNFVLLGGHTQTAFINMSQVAIFSLPQESWSFQNVYAGTQGSTELIIRSTSAKTPDSRSGHTAVLSSDGSAIIVFGGWVGDIHTPAEPQLAVLRLGSGFGGSGNWEWDIPTTSGIGLQTGQGIYGHDAIMLPGNVMMVIGGNIIASLQKRCCKRSTSNLQAFFFNTTSLAWSSEYDNPSYSTSSTSTSSPVSTSSNEIGNAAKVGLGAGLGLGAAAIIGALLVYCWYSRRLRRGRNINHSRSLRSAGSDTSIEGDSWWAGGGGGEMVQRQGLMSQHAGTRAMGTTFGNNDDSFGSYTVPAIGNRLNLPRKPPNLRNARGYYQPAPGSGPNFDYSTGHVRSNSLTTAGPIHPIYEADEDMEIGDAHGNTAGQQMGEPSRDQVSDPFIDPPQKSPLRSHPMRKSNSREDPPQSPAQEREREIQEWVADWEAADAILHNPSGSHSMNYHGGRISPSKESGSSRTESNLSERSAATVSALAISRQSSVNTRSNSITAFFASNAASWNPFFTPPHNSPSGPGDVSPISDRSAKQAPPHSSGSGTSSSFTTAQTTLSFPALRVEGETLLGRPSDIQEGSPSKSKPLKLQKQFNWLGSLKRALGGGNEEWVSSDGSASGASSPTRDRYRDRSPTSPTRAETLLERPEPRRTMSASATLWRRKQGKSDWEDSAEPEQRSNTLTLDGTHTEMLGNGNQLGEGQEEEEWDVEKAIRRRVVQVMFTVPKERLRVVNADDDDKRSEASDATEPRSNSTLREESTPRPLPEPPKPKEMDVTEVSPEPVDKRQESHDSEEVARAEHESKGKEIHRAETRSPERIVRDTVLEKSRMRGRSMSPEKAISSPKGRVAEMVEKMEGRV